MISPQQLTSTQFWLNHFISIWTAGPPIRLHTRDLDEAGNPEMHPAFLHWLDGTSGKGEGTGEDRARLKRAMKRLRWVSIREYEVLHRIMVLGEPVPDVTRWLNDRAIRGGHPERYTELGTLVILYAAVDKVRDWY